MTDGTRAPFALKERTEDGVIVIGLERGLKGAGEAALKQRVDAVVRAGHLEILVDMKHMPYVDSTELGRLIRSHISVRQAGGRVRLCNLSPRVVTLMKMTRLDTVLEVYDSEEEALAGIRRQRGQQSCDTSLG
jgi:anti-sigma B factor antagonist